MASPRSKSNARIKEDASYQAVSKGEIGSRQRERDARRQSISRYDNEYRVNLEKNKFLSYFNRAVSEKSLNVSANLPKATEQKRYSYDKDTPTSDSERMRTYKAIARGLGDPD